MLFMYEWNEVGWNGMKCNVKSCVIVKANEPEKKNMPRKKCNKIASRTNCTNE